MSQVTAVAAHSPVGRGLKYHESSKCCYRCVVAAHSPVGRGLKSQTQHAYKDTVACCGPLSRGPWIEMIQIATHPTPIPWRCGPLSRGPWIEICGCLP